MTTRDFNKHLRSFQRQLQTMAEAEVRKRWREEEKLIYVREFTVAAHFRPYRKRRKLQLAA